MIELFIIHDMGHGNRYIANWDYYNYTFKFLIDLQKDQKKLIKKFNKDL